MFKTSRLTINKTCANKIKLLVMTHTHTIVWHDFIWHAWWSGNTDFSDWYQPKMMLYILHWMAYCLFLNFIRLLEWNKWKWNLKKVENLKFLYQKWFQRNWSIKTNKIHIILWPEKLTLRPARELQTVDIVWKIRIQSR